MAVTTYVVRRAPSCFPADVQATLNTLVADGYDVVSILTHSTITTNESHDNRYCATDIVGSKKV